MYPKPDDPYLQDDPSFASKADLIHQPEPINQEEMIVKQDFILTPDMKYDDLDPLNFVPATSAGLFFEESYME